VGIVSFGHGTDSLRSYVPSAPTFEGLGIAGLFASGGFALVAPDYVGLGLSPGPHPYLHAATEASASLDLLMAAREASRQSGVKLPRSLYVTGFSQGGQAALALDRIIEADSDSPWRVVAVAPIAGPHDLSGTEFPEMIDGPSTDSSAYLAYLALSYTQIYEGNTTDIFATPYDIQVPSLFDGQQAFSQIAPVLPPPRALFRPEFLAGLSDDSQPFAHQLRENDTFQVVPRAQVRLYYGEADVDVFPRNTHVAASAMKSAGVQITEVNLGADADHAASEQLGLPAVRAWFDELVDER
jgi:pimeloyl-ACP methyl ester carboxylesterase